MKHHQRFDAWMKDNFLTNQAMADRIKAASGKDIFAESVRQWRAGKNNPGLALRPFIETVTGGKVTAKGW